MVGFHLRTFGWTILNPIAHFFPHRTVAALRAIFERCAGVRLLAVAFPPLRTSATAAGFFFFAISKIVAPMRSAAKGYSLRPAIARVPRRWNEYPVPIRMRDPILLPAIRLTTARACWIASATSIRSGPPKQNRPGRRRL